MLRKRVELGVTINEAVSGRVRELLAARGMSQYRLEQNSGIAHAQLGFILKNRNNSVNFRTIVMLARGFGVSIQEFLDSPRFDEGLEID